VKPRHAEALGPKGRSRRAEALGPILLLAAAALLLSSCQGGSHGGKRRIVVTYSILGSVVKDLVGDAFDVSVLIPDGLDPHEWEPSAKDIEAIDGADLVVENGLGLEAGMAKALDKARRSGRRVFTAADHVLVRTVGAGEGLTAEKGGTAEAGATAGETRGAEDPHLWTDPVTMQAIADALSEEIAADFKVDLSKRRADLDARLEALDAEVAAMAAALPASRRVLVTGHESMGYFAQRYGFRLVGAVLPSLSSQAESSASGLAALKLLIAKERVPVIFAELGTSAKVAEALAAESKVEVVELSTHALSAAGGGSGGGSYAEYLRRLASTVIGALSR
jgi:zinc/manganese transport system substrate-binding protein